MARQGDRCQARSKDGLAEREIAPELPAADPTGTVGACVRNRGTGALRCRVAACSSARGRSGRGSEPRHEPELRLPLDHTLVADAPARVAQDSDRGRTVPQNGLVVALWVLRWGQGYLIWKTVQ